MDVWAVYTHFYYVATSQIMHNNTHSLSFEAFTEGKVCDEAMVMLWHLKI